MSIRRDPFEMMDRMFEQMRRATMDDQGRLPTMDDTGRLPTMDGQGWFRTMDDQARFPSAGDVESGDRKFGMPFGSGSDANLRAEETEDGYVAMADLPGFEKEDITVRFEDGLLTIEAESETREDDEFTVSRRSRRVHEALRIPGSVLESEITASYRNGVLEIVVPTEMDGDDDEHVIDVE